MKKALTLLALVGAVFTAAPAAHATDDFEKIKVEAGQKLFEGNCRRCHATDAKDASYGPPLENIVGRGAGTYPGFKYSTALEASGIVWTPAALRAWMEDNDGFMPGTKMRHVGIEDRTVQDFILSYLQSITTRDGKEISK
ncbi:MAG: c-type cytochrome [Notoacmeibacter sp.]|nr:c-type cytochrome [Notoacmeibacter sp.]